MQKPHERSVSGIHKKLPHCHSQLLAAVFSKHVSLQCADYSHYLAIVGSLPEDIRSCCPNRYPTKIPVILTKKMVSNNKKC